jgi:lysophospholipase L1-like esterase
VITHPGAATVLCFGDSNTHGCPDDEDEATPPRLPADVRWTGRLQSLLGPRRYVVEEGLNGRTTDLEQPGVAGRSGRAYLVPCLRSHDPVAVVVLMLGTNDVKTMFGRTAADVAAALDGLLDDIATWAPAAATVLVGPVHIDDTAPGFAELTADEFGPGSVRASRELAPALRALAAGRGVRFADAATVAGTGHDGLHLDPASHERLAVYLAGIVEQALT